MPELSAALIARGGRPQIERECASDPSYGLANREIIRRITAEVREASEYDPRYDLRNGRREELEPWQLRR